MQVVKNEVYSNFIDYINSDQTRQVYEYTLSQFLKYYDMNMDSFLKLSQQEISNFIIDYLVNKKISRQYKIIIISAIKHACEMNDVILNWKKLKKFIKSEKRDNSINGKARGYTHEEIQDSKIWYDREKDESTYKRDLKKRIELIIWFLENVNNNDTDICKIIESKMGEIITKIKKISIFEADPLHSELRILDWILYQVCRNESKDIS